MHGHEEGSEAVRTNSTESTDRRLFNIHAIFSKKTDKRMSAFVIRTKLSQSI